MEKLFYFSNVLDGLNTLFVVLMILAGISAVAFLIFAISEYDEDDVKKYVKATIASVVVFFVSILGIIFVPDKKTYLLMKGGKAVDVAIENNEEIRDIPENTLNLLNEYIKTVTNELNGEDSESN